MSYTTEQILRISADKLGVPGKIYIDSNNNTYQANSAGRLIRKYLSDLNITTQPNSVEEQKTLRQYFNDTKPKQVEVDFGNTLHMNYKVFTIQDRNINPGDIIIANIAYDAPTDKDVDELEMDPIICTAGTSSDGSFTLLVKGLEGSLRNKFKVNYYKTWR